MRQGEDIKTMTDERGNRYFIIYSKDGVEHRIGQHLDALTAVQTGVYFATRPAVDKKLKKRQ